MHVSGLPELKPEENYTGTQVLRRRKETGYEKAALQQ